MLFRIFKTINCKSWRPSCKLRYSSQPDLSLGCDSKAFYPLMYTKDHQWLCRINENRIRFGLTAYGVQAIGDLVFVEMPSQFPKKVASGQVIGAVESVKGAADIHSPVSGTLVSINELAIEKPITINRDPENKGKPSLIWYLY